MCPNYGDIQITEIFEITEIIEITEIQLYLRHVSQNSTTQQKNRHSERPYTSKSTSRRFYKYKKKSKEHFYPLWSDQRSKQINKFC